MIWGNIAGRLAKSSGDTTNSRSERKLGQHAEPALQKSSGPSRASRAHRYEISPTDPDYVGLRDISFRICQGSSSGADTVILWDNA